MAGKEEWLVAHSLIINICDDYGSGELWNSAKVYSCFNLRYYYFYLVDISC